MFICSMDVGPKRYWWRRTHSKFAVRTTIFVMIRNDDIHERSTDLDQE